MPGINHNCPCQACWSGNEPTPAEYETKEDFEQAWERWSTNWQAKLAEHGDC